VSSEETGVVTKRYLGSRQTFPFEVQVEVPSAGMRRELADERALDAAVSWAEDEDWDTAACKLSNDVIDGMRVRVARFTVRGLLS
jgi:hypothetical protein